MCDRHAGFCKPLKAMVPMGQKDTVCANGPGDFVVVHGIADQNDFFRSPVQLPDPVAAFVNFSLGVNIVGARQP